MASYFRQVPNFDYISRVKGEHYISQYIPVKNLFKRGKLRDDIFGNLAFFEKYSIVGDERPDNLAYKIYNDSTLDWVILISNNILNIHSEWPMTQNAFDKVMLEKYGSYENLYSGIHHYETQEIKNSLGITVLKGGISISPSWRTNGNFIETINSKITNISAVGNVVTVTMLNQIPNVSVGDQVSIGNVTENEYNGKQIIETISENQFQFTYELPQEPANLNPTLTGDEQVIYTIPLESLDTGNAHYYEYWDAGLGYSVQVPSTTFVKEVTNYDYELALEEKKRNIYILKPKYLNIVFNDMDDIMPYEKGGDQYVNATLVRGDNIRLYE